MAAHFGPSDESRRVQVYSFLVKIAGLHAPAVQKTNNGVATGIHPVDLLALRLLIERKAQSLLGQDTLAALLVRCRKLTHTVSAARTWLTSGLATSSLRNKWDLLVD